MRTGSYNGKGRRRTVAWAIVGLVVVALFALQAATTLGSKPCASCHTDQAFAAATKASAHASVACARCHLSPGSMGQVAFALQEPLHTVSSRARAVNRDAASVPDSRCLACHEEALVGIVVSNGIRVNHASCAADGSCTSCHSTTAHGSAIEWVRTYDMDSCLSCHAASGRAACDLCHQGERPDARVKYASWVVTHGPNWKSTHGMGDVSTCTVCHKSVDCADCHGAGVPHEAKFVDVHAGYATSKGARCSTCHKSAFCDDCHGTKMPHAATFTRQHAASSKSDAALCKRCHDESDCTNCHTKHIHPGGAVGTSSTRGGAK